MRLAILPIRVRMVTPGEYDHAHLIRDRDPGEETDMTQWDEIGHLAEEIDRMTGHLQMAHDEILRQQDARQQLEGELRQAQKLASVGMLAAEVAHEIGTPLNIISGRAEVLGRMMGPEDARRRHLTVILQQTESVNGIIRALLDYARPRRPCLRAEAPKVILGRAAELMLERGRRRGVSLKLDLPEALPCVLANADQLQQLFLNLLLNALDASPSGGTVWVTVGPDPVLPAEDRVGIVRGEAAGPTLAVHIVDAGKGLTAEELEHVFDPFFSTKAQEQGTGLGLPIAEQIIQAHRGEIEMLTTPGRGTEVVVRLPLASNGVEDRVPEPTQRYRALTRA